jgi:hypothetical protein
MSALQSAPAEVRFTVSVTRAETGRVDTYDMVGHIELPPRPESQENTDVIDPRHLGT